MRQGPQKALTGSALDSRVAQFGMRSIVKSSQRITITKISPATSANGTITSVVPANTVIYMAGASRGNNADATSYSQNIQLTSATNVQLISGTTGVEISQSVEVIEYVPGVIKSKQTGTMSTIVSPATSSTATITTVDMNKTSVIGVGNTATGSASGSGSVATRYTLTNATTVTATRNDNSAGWTITPYYQVVEFY